MPAFYQMPPIPNGWKLQNNIPLTYWYDKCSSLQRSGRVPAVLRTAAEQGQPHERSTRALQTLQQRKIKTTVIYHTLRVDLIKTLLNSPPTLHTVQFPLRVTLTVKLDRSSAIRPKRFSAHCRAVDTPYYSVYSFSPNRMVDGGRSLQLLRILIARGCR